MAHSGGGQLTSRAVCALHKTPAQKNQPAKSAKFFYLEKFRLYSSHLFHTFLEFGNVLVFTMNGRQTYVNQDESKVKCCTS